MELDRRGVPGCVVATEAFTPAVTAQSESLGFRPAVHFVPHPIQNRTPEELAELADAAVPEVLALIGGHGQEAQP